MIRQKAFRKIGEVQVSENTLRLSMSRTRQFVTEVLLSLHQIMER